MSVGSEKPLAFTDEVTGLPLPILPLAPPGEDAQRSDAHHAFYEKDLFLHGTPGTRAVRFSRLQYGPRYYHSRYHSMFKGAALPENEFQEFTMTVLGFAGYVPDEAVDTSGTEPKVVVMNQAQRHHLQLPGILRTEHRKGRKAEIGQYLMAYALGLNEEFAEESIKEEFIETTNAKRKRELGFWLVAQAIETAVEPINPLYELAKRNKALRIDAAPCARLAVKQQVIRHVPDYFETLESRLLVA